MPKNNAGGMGGKFLPGNRRASKLGGDDVMQIREKYATGLYTYNRLAREYHVTSNTISNIVNMVTWQDLPAVQSHEELDNAMLRSMRKVAEMSTPTAADPNVPATELGLPKDFAESLLAREPAVDPSIAARAALYGAQSKPAIQAPPSEDRSSEHRDVLPQATPDDVAESAPERGAISLPDDEDGVAVEGAMLEDLLDQTTEESGK